MPETNPNYVPDGPAFTTYLAGLNGASYGGHNDWRLPTSGGCCGSPTGQDAELESIVDLTICGEGATHCIDQSVFGPMPPNAGYWSASTVSANSSQAFAVNFFYPGNVFEVNKLDLVNVRAVRGGS